LRLGSAPAVAGHPSHSEERAGRRDGKTEGERIRARGADAGIVDRRTWDRAQDRLRSPNPRLFDGNRPRWRALFRMF